MIHRVYCIRASSSSEKRKMCDKSSAEVLLRLLQGCNSMHRLLKIHAQVLTHGHQHHPSISSKLLSFCATSVAGDLSYAHLLFSSIPDPHTDHFNPLIRAFSSGPSPLLSLSLYNLMASTASLHSRPDPTTFSFLFKAIHRLKNRSKCLEAHGSLFRFDFSSNLIVCTNLIRCYVEMGLVEDACKVFDELSCRDLVAWNSMISCYHKAGLYVPLQ